ncbi:MAG: hypothetical protein CBC13_00690 [Planctomycetia bacterium TMED53]|nr:MAG: hypothetical protein CBC13_00690 [Planctomycetia bacterium TMED53]
MTLIPFTSPELRQHGLNFMNPIQHGIQSSLPGFLKESGPTNSDLSPQVPKDFFTVLGFHHLKGMSQSQICPPGMTNHPNGYSCSNSNLLKKPVGQPA